MLKDYKLPYLLYNFLRPSRLRHNLPLYRQYGIKKSYFSPVSSEDFRHLDSPPLLWDEKDSAREMPSMPAFRQMTPEVQSALVNWSKNGYVVLPRFFSGEQVDAVNAEIDRLLQNGRIKFKYRNKLMFAYRQSPLLKGIGTDERLQAVLDLLLGREAVLFQSINFLTGSQQRTHSDFIHMSTFPYGYLIAAWVALEDIHPDSGPVHYYPGSHRLPYVMNRDFGNTGTRYKLGEKGYPAYEDHIAHLIQKHRLKKEVFIARKGDVLIWHANLLHGGEPVVNPELSRKSMVFHYFGKGVICYHEITQRPALLHTV